MWNACTSVSQSPAQGTSKYKIRQRLRKNVRIEKGMATKKVLMPSDSLGYHQQGSLLQKAEEELPMIIIIKKGWQCKAERE